MSKRKPKQSFCHAPAEISGCILSMWFLSGFLTQEWRRWKRRAKLHIPGCIYRFALGFCKNIKKRTETLYQSFSPFMWNDSKNDTIHAFHFALGLSFYIGCIWVQNGCSRVQKRLGGCNTGLSFCYLLFRRNSHIPLLYTIIVLLCFSLLMGITCCSLVHKYSFA